MNFKVKREEIPWYPSVDIENVPGVKPAMSFVFMECMNGMIKKPSKSCSSL